MGEEAYDEVDLPSAHPRKPNDERTLCVRGGYCRTEVYVGICRTKYDDPDEIIAVDGAALKRALRGMQIGPPRERRQRKARPRCRWGGTGDMNAGDLTRGLEDLIAERDDLLARLRLTCEARNGAEAEVAHLNRECANRERAIAELARAAVKFGQVAGPAPGANERDYREALEGMIAALKEPLVVECVADADDAEARRNAKMVEP